MLLVDLPDTDFARSVMCSEKQLAGIVHMYGWSPIFDRRGMNLAELAAFHGEGEYVRDGLLDAFLPKVAFATLTTVRKDESLSTKVLNPVRFIPLRPPLRSQPTIQVKPKPIQL